MGWWSVTSLEGRFVGSCRGFRSSSSCRRWPLRRTFSCIIRLMIFLLIWLTLSWDDTLKRRGCSTGITPIKSFWTSDSWGTRSTRRTFRFSPICGACTSSV
uniref:(northern house mosquito) hypothetical protein n=1 Tax=Culex pipiens TaxID=7175 RepID=A0A8D8FVM5_CULPI